MLHADAPSVRPEFAKGVEKTRHGQRYFVVPDPSKGIVPEGLPGVWRVEVPHALALMILNTRSDTLNQVAVWVYERKPAAGSEILEHQAFEEGGLPDPRLADRV